MIRRLIFSVILLLAGLHAAAAQEARILVDDKTVSTNISDKRQLVVSNTQQASLLGLTESGPVVVKAVGGGTRHYWSLFSFKNIGSEQLNFVVTFQPQNFSGAGLLQPEMTVQEVLSAVSLHDGKPLRLTDGGGWQYAYISVPPNEVTNIAVETDGPAIAATLFRAAFFGSANVGPLFLTGFMQGMAILALIVLLGLYTFKPQRVTMAGALFGVSLLLFIEGDLGLFALPVLDGRISAALIRADVETLMAATVMLCVITFHSAISTRRLMFGGLATGIVAVGLANLIYAVIEPLNASAFARIFFVSSVVLGVLLAIAARHGKYRIGFDWLFWLSLLLWTGFAIFIAGWGQMVLNGHLWLAGATLVMLFIVTLVLIRYVAELRRGESPSLLRAELRSLALAAGQHIIWEWLPESNVLHVGPELPRRLNLNPDAWEQDGRGHFHAVLHPVDLAAYQNLAERNDFKPGEAASLELRVRGQDGAYHWYELQARAIRGAHHAPARVIGTLTDIDRLKTAADQLALDSVTDSTTGLPNRALFLDRLDRVLGQIGALPFRVIMLDIDRFKELNEGLGQEAGDTILKTVAHRITNLLDTDESAARLTGGQFVLHCTESLARGDFATFLTSLEEQVSAPIKLGSQEVVISASTGVSDTGSHDVSAHDLMDQAGVAMLEARKEGGARTVFYDEAMTDDRAKLFSLESDLRRALARNEIEIHYQPIVDLLTLEVRGFEALARWRHAELGLLSPADFMDIAETSGLMPEITQFMMLGAARQLGIWKRVHMRERPFFVSVNVSASQIVDPLFVGRVQSVVTREQPEPGSLKIEITETVIMRQPERSAQALRQLRGMGVGLACDDFGTGFSSLASLRDLPFDTLKIDRSFISGGNLEERNAKIITSITALAEGLNMAVVAEGIETQAQIDALAELGCTLGQGYLLGKPENAEGATSRLIMQRLAGVKGDPVPEEEAHPVAAVEPLAEEAPVAEEPLVIQLQPLVEEPTELEDEPLIADDEPVSVLATMSDVPAPSTSEPEELPSIFGAKLTAAVVHEPVAEKPKRKPRKKKADAKESAS